MLKIREVFAKSILNKSKIFDYCLNPYTGCQLGCVYCYARLFMIRYTGHKEEWGEFVDVKINAPDLLKRQLQRAKRGTVWVSSVCDPYQPLEKKYELTRRCLKELATKQFPVNIQTKSTLILRDMDLLLSFEEIEVGFTITTGSERIAKLFEPGAPPIKERIEALEKLHSKGIRTFAFVGPILPGNPEQLAALLQGKTDNILIDRMNYLHTVRGFYRHLGLEQSTRESFFLEYRDRFVRELRTKNMAYESLF